MEPLETTTSVTLEQAKATARQVVQQFGTDYTNPGVTEGEGCMYVDPYGAHCIAAQIAVTLGKPIPGLMDDDNKEQFDKVPLFHEHFTDDAIVWLNRLQKEADNGFSWGYALDLVS